VSVLVAPLETLRSSDPRSSKRLKVLTLAPFFPSVEDPVQGCFIAEPIRRISAQGIESHVVAVNPFYRGSRRASEAQSEWTTYYALPGNVGLVTSGASLARALRRRVSELQKSQAIDLIHAHAALPCGEAALTVAADLKVPCVVSVHGLDVFADRQCGRWLGPVAKRRSSDVYRHARKIVCISERVRQQLPFDLQAKAAVVYNGVDAEMFSAAREAGSSARIVSVGNLIPTKDHALLLRAFARVQRTLPESELEIIGAGPERLRLEELAKDLAIHSRVAFRGRQDRQTVASAMQNCAVFALPSRYEGLGCVYLEAMSCAKPVIGCSGQGIDEIIRDGQNGMLVPAGDETALADRLVELLQNVSLRQRLGVAARQTVLQSYTLDQQAGRLADIYRECVA
jgi:teichuronic acid biosynthesis glycosyltransferase TuaC